MVGETPRFGIVGWKDSGKTTLAARLVQELTRRGHRVAAVKRAHGAFDIDRPGTDSHAHRMAGAGEVAIVSERRWALMHENAPDEPEASLDAIAARLSPCDLVLVEGFKTAAHPKIEVRLHRARTPLLANGDPAIVAIAFDKVPADIAGFGRPVFQRDQTGAMAQLVEEVCGLGAFGHKRASS